MKWRTTGALVALLLAGWVQKAQAGDGVVALQTADPSCTDDSGHFYVDCGNGTVTDNRTGLVWLANADCLIGGVDWYKAKEFVAGLKDIPAGSPMAGNDCGLSDGSSPGEWRLPSVDEWEAMVADAVALGCIPAITDDTGAFCWTGPGPGYSFSGVQLSLNWSSSISATNPNERAWLVYMVTGSVFHEFKAQPGPAWPVRGGQ